MHYSVIRSTSQDCENSRDGGRDANVSLVDDDDVANDYGEGRSRSESCGV